MNSRSILIGTCELKRTYQRNLVFGFCCSGFLYLLSVMSILLFDPPHPGSNKIEKTLQSPFGGITLQPPPVKKPDLPKPKIVGETRPKPVFAIPKAALDNEEPEKTDIPTQDQLARLAPDSPLGNLDGTTYLAANNLIDELLPKPDSFIACDQMPVPVDQVQPVYPDLARRAGMEGQVWLKVLVDKDGVVRNVIIVKSSQSDIGFENSAREAAYQSTWKPAISNGIPVSIWVTYIVQFKLK